MNPPVATGPGTSCVVVDATFPVRSPPSRNTLNCGGGILTNATTSAPAAERAADATQRELAIAALTAGLAAGDEDAFREFHKRFFDRLLRVLLVLTRGVEQDAQDALQETFCRVVRYARRFDSEEVFWCWLVALARGAARDAGRKQRRHRALLRNYALRWLPMSSEPPDDSEARLERLLRDCLRELDFADRALLEGKYLLGSSVRELAESAALTEKAVESRLLRLRRLVRASLLRKLQQDSR